MGVAPDVRVCDDDGSDGDGPQEQQQERQAQQQQQQEQEPGLTPSASSSASTTPSPSAASVSPAVQQQQQEPSSSKPAAKKRVCINLQRNEEYLLSPVARPTSAAPAQPQPSASPLLPPSPPPPPQTSADGGGSSSVGAGADDDFDKILAEMQCPICLDVFADPATLPCGHTLCRAHVGDLAAMFHHPDTGVVEFDCPKCRVRCAFAGGFDEVRVNLEMKNMIGVVQRAAQKTRNERRSERERQLLAQLQKYEQTTLQLREKERATELERQRLGEEKDRVERERADLAAQGGAQAQQVLETEKVRLAKDRRRLERERQMLQQQKEEVDRHTGQLLMQMQHRPQSSSSSPSSSAAAGTAAASSSPAAPAAFAAKPAEEQARELAALKEAADEAKRRRREQRDRRIEEGLSAWLRRTEEVRAASDRARDGFLDGVERIDRIEGLGAPRATPPPPPPPPPPQPQPTAATPAPSVTPSPDATPATRYERLRGLPTAPPAVEPTAMVRVPPAATAAAAAPPAAAAGATAAAAAPPLAGRVNPITGFPDPTPLEEVVEAEGGPGHGYGEYFENQWRRQAYAMRPPRKVPEDYPNYRVGGLQGGVDYELEEVLGRDAERHEAAILKAHRQRVLAEKTRVAEQRAEALIAQYKAEQRAKRLVRSQGWDCGGGGASSSSAAGSRPRSYRPSFKPKLGRRQSMELVAGKPPTPPTPPPPPAV